MNRQSKIPEYNHNAASIGTWENEGGASHRDSMEHQYGRRIEADRSWTIYHVFTGVLARVSGQAMNGLSRADATNGMMSLNLRNAARRKERDRLAVRDRNAREIVAGSSWR